MNNKGQSLIVFVLLLPIMFLLMAIVYDLGSVELKKQKYENAIKDAITYGLKNKEGDTYQKLSSLLEKNIDGQKNISIEENKITIEVTKKEPSIFTNIIKNYYDIDITYTGHLEGEKIIIRKK